ncbi:MAG: SDR family oxidoreductase [Actinomycetota bacterium]
MINDLDGKIAVVTGGGTGMGRELVRQLAIGGADVAFCDIAPDTMAETAAIVIDQAPDARLLTHQVDVASEGDLESFRAAVCESFETDHINLLFNNAGIAGGGSMFDSPREQWEKTFDIDWGGVYLGCRVFLPLLAAADAGAVINTSSVNGFYASVGPDRPHTAYSAAKFAVKGFTVALMADLAVHAPQVSAHLVMPGHIGTKIVANTMRQAMQEPTPEEAEFLLAVAEEFETKAPMTAEEAARVILDAVLAGEWRILVGDDAHELDRRVRADPEGAYRNDLFTLL